MAAAAACEVTIGGIVARSSASRAKRAASSRAAVFVRSVTGSGGIDCPATSH